MNEESTAALALLSRMRFACGDNGLRMQDELEEYLRGLKRDSDELAKLRAEIAGLAKSWRERRPHADALDKACGGSRFADIAAGMGQCADELESLLRLPAGEPGEAA